MEGGLCDGFSGNWEGEEGQGNGMGREEGVLGVLGDFKKAMNLMFAANHRPMGTRETRK